MSWQAQTLNWYLRHVEKPRLRRAATPAVLRRAFEWNAKLFFHAPLGATRSWRPLGTGDALHVNPSAAEGPVILYLHGGAFVFGSPRTHSAMLAALAQRARAQAILPRYPLAPEHPFPAALDHVTRCYADLIAELPSERVIIGGDSAGGALVFGLLARILAQGLTRPAGVFAFSPLTDLTFSGVSFERNRQSDVLLPTERAQELAGMYLGRTDPASPEVSPLYADLAGAPPVWMSAGRTEILRDDTVRMADHLKAQGVPVTYDMAQDLPHVWPIFHNTLPEARRTLERLACWMDAQTGASAAVR